MKQHPLNRGGYRMHLLHYSDPHISRLCTAGCFSWCTLTIRSGCTVCTKVVMENNMLHCMNCWKNAFRSRYLCGGEIERAQDKLMFEATSHQIFIKALRNIQSVKELCSSMSHQFIMCYCTTAFVLCTYCTDMYKNVQIHYFESLNWRFIQDKGITVAVDYKFSLVSLLL